MSLKFTTPISGSVLSANELLESTPALINEAPYDTGWILMLEPNDLSNLNALLSPEDYGCWVGEVEASREKWSRRNGDFPAEDMIGMIVGTHRVVSIQGSGVESVVFNLQNVQTGEIDLVWAVPRTEFRRS